MSKKAHTPEAEHDLVLQVLNDFLGQLQKDPKVGPEISGRLRSVLIEKQQTSAESIQNALFPEEPIT